MKPITPNVDPASLVAKTKKQLSDEMGFSMRTFQRRLREAQVEVPRGLVAPEKQFEIYQKLGWRKMAPDDVKWRQLARCIHLFTNIFAVQ